MDKLSFAAAIAWPVLVAIALLAFRARLSTLLDAAITRVQGGDTVTIGMITIGQSTGPLKPPASGEHLSDDHLALIHRSWHTGKHDAKFAGQKMYNIHVKVFGTRDALRRIDYVVYLLDRAYPDPARLGGPPETNFQLKELANGYSLVRADVSVRGQAEPVRLSRLVDLTQNCDRFP